MRKSLLTFTTLLAVACGSAPTPVPTNPVVNPKEIAGSSDDAPVVPAATAYDLSPVREPEDVIGLVSWKSPKAMVASFSDCAGLPVDDVMSRSEAVTRQVLREFVPQNVDTRQLAAVVALDAPVFLLASLDPQSKQPNPLVAISVGLVSLDKAKQAVESAGPLTELGPGLYRVAGRTSPMCVVAAAAGSTPARLVCGEKERDVTTLAPYLTRTLPTAPMANDLHAELRVPPAEARFGSLFKTQVLGLPAVAQAMVVTGDAGLDKVIVDASADIADEVIALASDIDKVTIDATMDPVKCFHASAALSVRGKTSWTAGLMSDRPERAGAPPDIFWRAPKDSASVFYGRGTDPKRFSPILRVLRAAVEGGLRSVGVGSDADVRAVGGLLDWPMTADAATVSASGRVEIPESKDKKLTSQQEADAIVSRFVGWSLVGIEEGPAMVSKQMKGFADTYSRKGIQAPLKKLLAEEMGPKSADLLPKIKVKKGPASLGADSLDLQILVEKIPARKVGIKGAPEKDVVNLELHALLMSDGKSRTWVAFGSGSNTDALVKRLLSVKKDAPESGTITSRKDLEPLRRGTAMSAGFITVGPLVKSLQGSGSLVGGLSNREKLDRVIRSLATMPHQGDTPIFVTTSVTGADITRGDVSVDVSKDTLEDLGWLLKTMPR